MITLRNMEELLEFYISFGGKRSETKNGFCYTFPETGSFVRFWGDLNGFSAAAAEFTFPEDMIFRNHLSQRYIGVGFIEEGSSKACTYRQKRETRYITSNGVCCYVLDSPHPFFMKLPAGERTRFQALYFQENFFRENEITLYDSFWRDARETIGSGEIRSPELVSIYRQIENCALTGDIFDTWLRGQGLSAAAHIMELIRTRSAHPPVYLDRGERDAIDLARQILREQISNAPTIPELCRMVGMNKNKLQKGFRLTTGKSIAEYVRTVRMERALELLEQGELSMRKIAEKLGYQGISNFYRAFRQTFGETPMSIQSMLRSK